jgi:hypothetical protein
MNKNLSSPCKHFFITLIVILGSTSIGASEIKLVDGTVFHGEIIAEADSFVIIHTENLGDLKVNPALIIKSSSVESSQVTSRMRRRKDSDPSGHALFFLPTAFVPPRGTVTFRDFELFFLNFGYSITNSTVISGGFLFPITTEYQILTAGFKQQLWSSKTEQTAIALTGNATMPFEQLEDKTVLFLNSNLVASRRYSSSEFSDAFGIHAGIGYAGAAYEEDVWNYTTSSYHRRWKSQDNYSFGGGIEYRVTPHSKFMLEMLSATPFDFEAQNFGLLTIGIRLHGDRLSADIAGFRPQPLSQRERVATPCGDQSLR